LLNFDAYSFPDIGGWIVIGAASIMFLVWLFDWYKAHKRKIKLSSALVTSFILFFLTSCTSQPEPLKIGSDVCSLCKMGVADSKYGSEIITDKGKIYKFDDIGCMIRFIKTGNIAEKNISRTVVVNYEKQNDFIDAGKAVFLVSEVTKSPMGFNIGAFSKKESASKIIEGTSGKILSWTELYNQVE
jgi:copper chaperone NosL